jgi:hypothetical protein
LLLLLSSLLRLSPSLLSVLSSSGGRRGKAAISSLSASLGVGSSWVSVLPIDPVSALLSNPVSALLLSSGGSQENAAISSLGASLGVGSSWCSESS